MHRNGPPGRRSDRPRGRQKARQAQDKGRISAAARPKPPGGGSGARRPAAGYAMRSAEGPACAGLSSSGCLSHFEPALQARLHALYGMSKGANTTRWRCRRRGRRRCRSPSRSGTQARRSGCKTSHSPCRARGRFRAGSEAQGRGGVGGGATRGSRGRQQTGRGATRLPCPQEGLPSPRSACSDLKRPTAARGASTPRPSAAASSTSRRRGLDASRRRARAIMRGARPGRPDAPPVRPAQPRGAGGT